jgi:hypothetical protein
LLASASSGVAPNPAFFPDTIVELYLIVTVNGGNSGSNELGIIDTGGNK